MIPGMKPAPAGIFALSGICAGLGIFLILGIYLLHFGVLHLKHEDDHFHHSHRRTMHTDYYFSMLCSCLIYVYHYGMIVALQLEELLEAHLLIEQKFLNKHNTPLLQGCSCRYNVHTSMTF